MAKRGTRNPVTERRRHQERLRISVETLLRIYLGLADTKLNQPLPLSREEVLKALRVVAEEDKASEISDQN